jgi:pimeloyl-ACP methyl ester carboxylesterase
MVTQRLERLRVWAEQIEVPVDVRGDGPPLVFLHGAGGPHLQGDEFLDRLAQSYTLYMPHHPGTGESDPNDVYKLDNLWDLVLLYDELLEGLGLGPVPIIGHSYGGMLACELAAHCPGRVSRLVAIAPIGLWREDQPVTTLKWTIAPPQELPALLAHDLQAPAVQRFLGSLTPPPGADTETQVKVQARFVWALASTGKFVWPIPDKGLRKRLHRIRAPTLIIWGEQDALVPVAYGEEFARRIKGARLEVVRGAGHLVQLEQVDRVVPMVLDFLRG